MVGLPLTLEEVLPSSSPPDVLLHNCVIRCARDSVLYLHYLVVRTFGKDTLNVSEAERKKRYRALDSVLVSSGLFVRKREGNLVYYVLSERGRRAYIDLMRGASAPQQNSNRTTAPTRAFAEKLALTNKRFGHYEGKEFRRYEVADVLEDVFSQYKENSRKKRILLQHKYEAKGLLIPYSTRWTSPRRRRAHFAKYSAVWKNASAMYKDAVFLTLTTDPSRHESVYHATKSMSKSFNRFMSWLKKYLQKPDLAYIKALEFTKAGYPHLHVVLFGVDFIAPPSIRKKVRALRRLKKWDELKQYYKASKEKITERWSATGQGEINYVYSIYCNEKGHWQWRKYRPHDANGKSPSSYLKKYFAKALSDSDSYRVALYWATNTRFYTCSRALQQRPKKRKRPALWEFVASLSVDELYKIPSWMHVRDGTLIVLEDG